MPYDKYAAYTLLSGQLRKRKLAVVSLWIACPFAILCLLSLGQWPTMLFGTSANGSGTRLSQPQQRLVCLLEILSGQYPTGPNMTFNDLLGSIKHNSGGPFPDPGINLFGTAVGSLEDIFQLGRELQAPKRARNLSSPDLIVIPGVASTEPGMHLDRYLELNDRLAAVGYSNWYWQFGWSPPYDHESSEAAKTLLLKFASKEMADLIQVEKINYVPSLELKHIMAMHDAYHGDLTNRHYQELSMESYGDLPQVNPSQWATLPRLTRDQSTIWIMEDDAIFVPQYKSKLSAILNHMPPDIPWIVWTGACINLHTTDRPEGSIIIPADPDAGITTELLISPCSVCDSRCSHSYMVNRLGVGAILEVMQLWAPTASADPIDWYFSRITANLRASGRLQSYWVEPALVYQSGKMEFSIGR
jgi:hypothetical protein